ncbi:UNVERIFIED_CONTAM: putative F-box/FBD/LRR-repeat protein [Sesamum latifolium]|uniref:F-box/FBD/LRR-repeat protein n=1 Tax=Sesamum latifolium TaxID=2727402 RepID=A0AAW2SN44_9LAMI
MVIEIVWDNRCCLQFLWWGQKPQEHPRTVFELGLSQLPNFVFQELQFRELHSVKMDVSVTEVKETGGSRKRPETCEDNKDFLSNLPDPILVHILSFLPLRDAIKTVLFRQFGNLWLSMPVLDLDNCLYHEYEDYDFEYDDCDYENFMDLIHQVWNYHNDTTLDKLRLKLCFELQSKNGPASDYANKEKERAAADQIENLVVHAISRKVKILDLDFKGCAISGSMDPLTFYEFPDHFRSNYLTDLRLAACDITSFEEINLPALRVLFLKDVAVSDEVMEKLLLGCQFLEDLSVVNCYGLGKMYCMNPNLKKVMVFVNIESRQLFLSCPHAVSLHLSGWIQGATLLNVSSLVDCSLSFSYKFKCEQRSYDSISRLLLGVHRCKTFIPCTWSILVLTIWKLNNFPCPRFKWKNLRLTLDLTKWHHPGLSLLFKSSQSLETLSMYISHSRVSISQFVKAARWIEDYEFDVQKYWDLQEADFPFLESITLHGHINEPSVIQMLKFLLKNAPRLRQVLISAKHPAASERKSKPYTSGQLKLLRHVLMTNANAFPYRVHSRQAK